MTYEKRAESLIEMVALEGDCYCASFKGAIPEVAKYLRNVENGVYEHVAGSLDKGYKVTADRVRSWMNDEK